MANKITLTDEIKKYLKKLVDQNPPLTTNRIKIMFNKEFDKNYARQTIVNKIREVCKKKCNTPRKEDMGIDKNTDYKNHNSILDGQVKMIFDENNNGYLSDPLKDTSQKSTKKKASMKSNTDHIMNYLLTLDKNIKPLDSKMNKIVNFINKFEEENSPEKLKQFSDVFIRIYAGTRNKDSVNINAEIKQRVMKEMEKIYKIRKNQSLAINTALLVALYNPQDRGNQDKNEK
ncbi:hypothetical protein [Inediibacterium massiliense]|uniref:hypothetical protein n=1 Tax=Inediibacterium massiliense TaxID=1658111 RepID=UPI0006B43056|nr:hypothetical protein [Inediibacterium massiliense]